MSSDAARRRERLGLLLAFVAFASWGLLSPVGKHFLETGAYGPLGLNFVRFALATAIVILVAGPRAVAAGFRLLARRDILLTQALANLSLTLFLYSMDLLAEPTFATLGFFAAPLLTAALAQMRLGEPMGPWFAPAALLFVLGGYLALFGFAPPPAGFGALGMGLAVASALVWALFAVELRRAAPTIPLRPLMVASFVAGTVWYGVLTLAVEGIPDLAAQTASSWRWMALYVAVPTLASFVLFSASLQMAPAGAVNILVGAELAFTALFSALLFGERFTAAQLAGLALVLASVSGYLWLRSRGTGPPARSPSLIKTDEGMGKR
jgi:drug/metabolite transporter (DMT)-like permease